MCPSGGGRKSTLKFSTCPTLNIGVINVVCANRTKVNFPIRNPWTRERDYGFEAILCSRVGWITDWQYGLRIDKIAFGREVWFLIFFNWKLFQSPIRNP